MFPVLRTFSLSALLLTSLLLPQSGLAAATIFNVNSEQDIADANPGDGKCLTALGKCTLRAAIDEANALSPAASALQINLPAGTFKIGQSGTGDDQNATGDLDIRCNLVIDGGGSSRTVIDADGLDRVLDIAYHFPPYQVVIQDVTLTGGRLPVHDGGKRGAGAGVINQGELTLRRVMVKDNATADGNDAQVHLDPDLGPVIDKDAAPGGPGGGIYNSESLTLVDSTVSNNATGKGGKQDRFTYVDGSVRGGGTAQSGGAGGGIYSGYGSSLTLLRSSVLQNHTGSGGNCYHYGLSCPGNGGPGGGIYAYFNTLEVTDSVIAGNWTGRGGGRYPDPSITIFCNPANGTCQAGSGGDGGGIKSQAGSLSLSGSTVANNHTGLGGGHCGGPCTPGSAGQGGGINAWNKPEVSIVSSTISGNIAGRTDTGTYDAEATVGGGGLYQSTGTLQINSSTFSGNQAYLGGGIHYAGVSKINGQIRDATITLNKAHNGGGILWTGALSWNSRLDLGNTILTDNNAAGAGPDCFVQQSTDPDRQIQSLGFNLLGDDSDCGFATAASDRVRADPRLGPLADNGGPTLTHKPARNGAAVDHGGNCLARDQRGVARPVGTACDVGAVEYTLESAPGHKGYAAEAAIQLLLL